MIWLMDRSVSKSQVNVQSQSEYLHVAHIQAPLGTHMCLQAPFRHCSLNLLVQNYRHH